jgi:hypothetical protein
MLPTKAEVDVDDVAAAAVVVAVAFLAALFPVAIVNVVASSVASCYGCCDSLGYFCCLQLLWLL